MQRWYKLTKLAANDYLNVQAKGDAMKKLTIALIISCSTLMQPVFSAQATQRAISYLTSWGIPSLAEVEIARSNVDTLILSFGQWDAQGNIQVSDGMTTPSFDSYWISSSYLTWTQFKFDNPNKKVMVAFGGQTYEGIWEKINTAASRELVATGLVKLLNQTFPVYKKVNGLYQQVGTIQLDGIDFDFEKAARLTADENANLLALAQLVRQKLGSASSTKLLSLTTYHVGADPVECADATVTQGCSYVETARSSHHGEVLPILSAGKNTFDFFNVMAYDAGQNFKYDVAMSNYAQAVADPSKVILGTTINSQWGPTGSFVETQANNIARAKWQASNNYGGFFVWALGSNNQGMTFAAQVDYINAMITAAKGAN
ncbi:glycoside hydrolase family 18 protein [Providencia stuartii]|uniref:glycoside hydrolase family 18 protein n=1 Tax=Providencia stuartii TaxID=588 RepID=UPI00300D3B97